MSETSERELKKSIEHVSKHHKIMKAQIECYILRALKDFEAETGCTIAEIDVDFMRAQSMTQETPVTVAVKVRSVWEYMKIISGR